MARARYVLAVVSGNNDIYEFGTFARTAHGLHNKLFTGGVRTRIWHLLSSCLRSLVPAVLVLAHAAIKTPDHGQVRFKISAIAPIAFLRRKTIWVFHLLLPHSVQFFLRCAQACFSLLCL